MKDQGRGPATYVVPWAPHLVNWALSDRAWVYMYPACVWIVSGERRTLARNRKIHNCMVTCIYL